jgi:hypothetical protein
VDWFKTNPSTGFVPKDEGGPPKAHEGCGLLLETGEQISSWECVFQVRIHIINTFIGFGTDNRGNVSLLEQRKTVTQFQVLGLGNSLELVNRLC